MRDTPKIKDICERLSLSKATVSKALNGYSSVSEETRMRVLACASELGYPLTDSAPQQKSIKNPVRIGFPPVGPSPNSSPYSDLQAGFLEQASPLEYEMVVLPPLHLSKQTIPFEQLMNSLRLDCALIHGFRTDDQYFMQLQTTTFPTITWDLKVNNPHVPNVGCDSVEGMRLAVEHLIALGHRKIGFICGHREAQVSAQRLDGYILALFYAGIPYDPALVYNGDFSEESGREGAAYLMRRHVTGIVCISDLVAAGACRTINAMGLSIPEDVSIIGYDDTPLTTIFTPALTSVQQNSRLLGRTLNTMFFNMVNGLTVGDAIVHPSLTVRASTASPRSVEL